MEPASPDRRALPWQAIVAATVLALLASGLVLVLLADGDGADGDTASDATTAITLVPSDEVATGDPVDVAFTTTDGSSGTIGDRLEGRPMVVNFFASTCPPCITEMPAFEEVATSLAGRVDFFGLAVQDREEDAAQIVERTGVTYPWALDIRGDVIASSGSVVLPTTMFVAADGTVAEVHAGAVETGELRRMIAEHLGVEA